MPNETDEQDTVRYVRCAFCGIPNAATSTICIRCGKPLPLAKGATPQARAAAPAPSPGAQPIVCQRCHKTLPPNSKFCGYCGAPLTAPAPQPAPSPLPWGTAPTPPAPPIAAPEPAMPPPPSPPPMPARPPVASPAVSAPPAAAPVVPSSAPPATPPLAAVPPLAPAPAVPLEPKPVPAPAPAPSVPVGEATQVFVGLRVPKIEASISEVKPDGSVGRTVRVTKQTFIGRENCDLTYPDDALLAARHASLAVVEGKLLLKDLGSRNGTFVKQRQDSELNPGDIVLLGRQLFRFTTQSLADGQGTAPTLSTQVMVGPPSIQRGPVVAKLERIQMSGEVVEEFKLEKPDITIGRTTGDLVFKHDPYMSGTHARIVAQPGRFILQDLKSRNGVYRRIRAEAEIRDGDEFFLGEQLFRVEVKTV